MALDDRCDQLIRQGWRAARQTHRGVKVRFRVFRAHVEACVASRLTRSPEDVPHDILERVDFSDLYLACGCEQSDERAWMLARELLGKSVYWRLRRMGASHGQARQAEDDFPGRWAEPPRSGKTKTLFGRYLGIGSLRGYVMMVEARRWTRTLSDPLRRWLSIEAQEPELPAAAEARRDAKEDDLRTYQIIDAAWRRLDARSRASLVLKFVHGLKQREISRVFHLSESQVSRILRSASAVLQDALAVWIESGIVASKAVAASVLLQRMHISRAHEPYRPGPGPL